HRAVAESAAEPAAEHVAATRDWAPARTRGVVEDLLHALPERTLDDRRSGIGDLDPLFRRLLDDPRLPLGAGRADGNPLGAPIDGASNVGLVHEDAPDRHRVPLATSERGDAGVVQLIRDRGHATGFG